MQKYTLKDWVYDQGGALSAGQKLGVTDQAVWKWLRGDGAPRIKTMQKIVRLSNDKLTIFDLIEFSLRKKLGR